MPESNRALVIREPWIGLILSGAKTWEMRSQPTRIRGKIWLIRAKSGLIVGRANLVDSRPPLNSEDYMQHRDKHAIPETMLDEVIANRWTHPWVFSDIEALAEPVRYNHKSGAVTFVTLDPSEVEEALAEIGGTKGYGAGRRMQAAPAITAVQSEKPLISDPTDRPRAINKNAVTGHRPTSSATLFVFRPERAEAFGRPLADKKFLVCEGSTAMRNGSASVKRDRDLRDDLVRAGVLVADSDPTRYRFACDHVFSSNSTAAGIVKDGNASGSTLWKDPDTGLTLRDYLDKR